VGGLGWASSSGDDAFTAPFDGQMADVEIYDQALDQDAIQALSEESAFDWAV
jgi:hypothetical protein